MLPSICLKQAFVAFSVTGLPCLTHDASVAHPQSSLLTVTHHRTSSQSRKISNFRPPITTTPVLQSSIYFRFFCCRHPLFLVVISDRQHVFMQNPLRRPKGNPPPPTDRDVERNKNDDGAYLAKDVRGHLVAMSGEFVGTFMFLYFAFAATQIASTSNMKPILPPFRRL